MSSFVVTIFMRSGSDNAPIKHKMCNTPLVSTNLVSPFLTPSELGTFLAPSLVDTRFGVVGNFSSLPAPSKPAKFIAPSLVDTRFGVVSSFLHFRVLCFVMMRQNKTKWKTKLPCKCAQPSTRDPWNID